MFPLGYVADGDWNTVRRNTDATAQRLNPVLPQARVYNNADISVPNTTVTVLTFNSERWDSGTLHSTSSNTGRLTAPITGLYQIGCCVQWAANATGYRLVRIVHSSAAVIVRDVRLPISGDVTEQPLATSYQLQAGEYVYVEVYQSSGGALNVLAAGNTSPEFWMVRLGGYTNMGVS